MIRCLTAFCLTLLLTHRLAGAEASDDPRGAGVPDFEVRPGYRVTLAADDLGEARFIQLGNDGVVFLSQPDRGTVLALRDTDRDGTFDQRVEFVTGRKGVHSMDFVDGWLWISNAPQGSVFKARDTDGDLRADDIVDVVARGRLPSGGGHPTYGILVGKSRFYVAVSDPSNMDEDLKSDRKTIYSFSLDGSDQRTFATGIRNTEKLRFRPTSEGEMTSEIWGADHGSDWFGRPYGDSQGNQPITDLNPPDELNHYVEGGFYGHPFITGNRVPRPEFVNREDLHALASRTIAPAWSYGAHWAANGFTFVQGERFTGLRGDLVQAFHGSWNSSKRVGYCVSRVAFDPMTGLPWGLQTIVDCFDEKSGRVLGRPVDVIEDADGTLLFTCSLSRRIYRIDGR
jgi:glucose/arabinose dehydrogenase